MNTAAGTDPFAAFRLDRKIAVVTVVNMTRALAVEWAQSGIRVNAVAATWVRTDLAAGLLDQPGVAERIAELTPLRRLATPQEVANTILFLASPAAAMITGHTLPVDGGFLAQ
jgi:NAD(P)-dependent dehydrogenase (short-subunit alcohol dehydrogenase family)